MAFVFYFDMTRCIGCRACQVACKDKNRLEVGTLYRNVKSYTVGTFPDVKNVQLLWQLQPLREPDLLGQLPDGCDQQG